jgi:hypothetical protein
VPTCNAWHVLARSSFSILAGTLTLVIIFVVLYIPSAPPPPAKCRDGISNRSWQLPSRCFLNHHSPIILPFVTTDTTLSDIPTELRTSKLRSCPVALFPFSRRTPGISLSRVFLFRFCCSVVLYISPNTRHITQLCVLVSILLFCCPLYLAEHKEYHSAVCSCLDFIFLLSTLSHRTRGILLSCIFLSWFCFNHVLSKSSVSSGT